MLMATIKHGIGSAMVWTAVPWFSVELIVTLKERITGKKHRDIFVDQAHSVMQTLKFSRMIMHVAGIVQSWIGEVKHLPWLALSLDFNIAPSSCISPKTSTSP
ncbi:hypothetical protein TNCV_2949541 [Trichonephila clavipes]|nr:hypothetical protein TNCV_2949541 [Trichonephila clavipes]